MFYFSFLFIGMEKQCSGVQKTTVPGPNNTRGAESKRPGVGGDKSTRLPKIGEIGVDLNMGGGEKNRSPSLNADQTSASDISQCRHALKHDLHSIWRR